MARTARIAFIRYAVAASDCRHCWGDPLCRQGTAWSVWEFVRHDAEGRGDTGRNDLRADAGYRASSGKTVPAHRDSGLVRYKRV